MESIKFHDNFMETVKGKLERPHANNRRLHQEIGISNTKLKTFETTCTSMVTIKTMKGVAPTCDMEVIEQS